MPKFLSDTFTIMGQKEDILLFQNRGSVKALFYDLSGVTTAGSPEA